MNLISELLDWLQALPADFAFLLALPFAVGAAGLAAEWYRRRGKPVSAAGTDPRCALPASPP